MKIATIILARGESKGIPNKNIIDFCGKPLIAWTIEQAKNSNMANEHIYVSSDDHMILGIAEDYGAIPIERPARFATDAATSESALQHAIKWSHQDFDAIVFLQPTSPIRTSDDIDNAIKLYLEKEYDSLFSAIELEDFCGWLVHSTSCGDKLLPAYDYRDRQRRQDKKDTYYLENGSIYIFKPEILFDNDNRLGGDIGIYPMEKYKQYEIDEWDDLGICEFFMRRNAILQ